MLTQSCLTDVEGVSPFISLDTVNKQGQVAPLGHFPLLFRQTFFTQDGEVAGEIREQA